MATDHGYVEEDYEARFDWGVWRRIFSFALPYRRYLVPMAVVSVLTAGVDASFTLVVRRVIDEVESRGLGSWLGFWAAVYAGLVLALCAGVWLFIVLGGKIATGISHDIRRAGFAKLQELPFSFYDERPVGWLMARLTSDCDRLAGTLGWRMVDALWATCLLIGIGTILMLMHWKLAALVFAIVPLLVWVSVVFRRRLLRASRQVRKANSYLTAGFNEAIMGVQTTKTLVREEENLREFRDRSREMYEASVRNALYAAVFLPLVFSLGALGTALVLWMGGRLALAGTISVGTLLAFLAYTGQFFEPVRVLAGLLGELQTAQASGERIMKLLDTEAEIRDSDEVVDAMKRAATEGGSRGKAIDGHRESIERIEFRDVGFRYRKGPPVLEGFNLEVRAGETIALVGPTGGGKTTIVALLCRFYEPTAGGIYIDGIEYRRRSLHWLRSNLGIVLQTPHLFRGTIRENIRYGRLDASDEEVEAAARIVHAHGFIVSMRDGYDTEVGEGGDRLSTGQKQLVAFARAVLADPRIFVMDEATSSVDTETERLIQRGLRAVLRGRISFIIAHRLSTIRSADRILVIEAGRIVEEGTHGALLRRGGYYHDLYLNQFAREREAELLGAVEE